MASLFAASLAMLNVIRYTALELVHTSNCLVWCSQILALQICSKAVFPPYYGSEIRGYWRISGQMLSWFRAFLFCSSCRKPAVPTFWDKRAWEMQHTWYGMLNYIVGDLWKRLERKVLYCGLLSGVLYNYSNSTSEIFRISSALLASNHCRWFDISDRSENDRDNSANIDFKA